MTAARPAARRSIGLIVALVAAVGLLAVPIGRVGPVGPLEVRAATPDLTIVSTATYDVQPEQRRVRVTVDLTLTNHLRDSKTKRFYFDEAFLAVLPQASGYRVSWSGKGTPVARVTKSTKQYKMLRLVLPTRLYSGKTARVKLTFDLKDTGGSATRDLRVGDSLVSFPVWAYATDSTSGSAVTVRFPKGFDVQVQAGDLPGPKTDAQGRAVFSSGKLAKPLSFFAYLVGDRPGSYKATPMHVQVGDTPATLVLRSWPDDAAWAKRVGGLLRDAVPILGEEIGVPWPHDGDLTVQEAVSRSTGGYAGLFDPDQRRVEIAYYAGDFVVLHEAAHAWFNGSLLADRWANEAFASHYAEQAAAALKIKAHGEELTKDLLGARIPLNAWGPVGTEATKAETYGYAASLAFADAVAKRAGDDGLRAVWEDAATRVGAYQPQVSATDPAAGSAGPTAPEPELVDAAPDWRGLLDLLEADTGHSYVDLWRSWVARPADLALLDARGAARERYDAVVADAADWRLPRQVRDAMRGWHFDDATVMLDDASAALQSRDQIAQQAGLLGLTPPVALRAAFEDDDGFDDASVEAAAELEAIQRYRLALSSQPTDQGPIIQLGLWSQAPEADLAAARSAFEQGDLAGAAAAAGHAASAWSSAESLGQGRAVSLTLLALAGILALFLAVATVRRRRPASGPALATAVVAPPRFAHPITREAGPPIDPVADTVRHHVAGPLRTTDEPAKEPPTG